jgi:hypothetical protein
VSNGRVKGASWGEAATKLAVWESDQNQGDSASKSRKFVGANQSDNNAFEICFKVCMNGQYDE